MRGIAFKIFLSFWLIFAVMIASFAIFPDQRVGFRFREHVREYGFFAAALLERHGAGECGKYAATVESTGRARFELFDARGHVVCRSPGADLARLRPHIEAGQGLSQQTSDGFLSVVEVRGPSGATFVAAGLSAPAFGETVGRPPFPYGAVALTIVLSGLVCFAVARYLARPLRLVRDASYRLAAGDLHARAGPSVGRRRDEIGELVRDFDVMAGRLEALVHAQSQLLSDISHELRSPLARLNVALELARRKADKGAFADIDRAEAEAARMNDLIGRVLALARAENAPRSTMSRTDLAAVVRQVAQDADYEAQRQDKSVEFHAARIPAVMADRQLIVSAVDNVVRNALRHAPPHSTVEVSLSSTPEEVTIRVRDQGPGVPEGELEGMFIPFHRVESARNRDAGGVGLGLAIARRAVAVHGGAISAENATGRGLIVSIRLPLERRASGPAESDISLREHDDS